jgi:hypothetical protein
MIPSTKIIVASLAGLALLCVSLPAQKGPGKGGNGGGGNGTLITYINSLPKETVSTSEKNLLLHMREEEKLARDVYTVLFQVTKVKAFGNIAKAEQQHMDLIKMMLDRYGIKDPLISDKVGDFPSATFSSLFQTLALFGINSKVHAELVGAFIEDLDIYDLNQAIKATNNRDINTVWQNLNRGSRNHMRAFYGLLKAQNILYPGIILPQATILAIVNSAHETAPVDENGKVLP